MQDGTIAVSERYVAGRYRAPARLMHWLVALIVLRMIPVGITMGRDRQRTVAGLAVLPARGERLHRFWCWC